MKALFSTVFMRHSVFAGRTYQQCTGYRWLL